MNFMEVKLWDLSNNQPSCVASTNPKAVGLEDGTLQGFDIQGAAGSTNNAIPSFTLHPHDKAICSISYNPSVPNFPATGSTDKMVEDREREREKANTFKEEIDAGTASKRRKLKRDHMPSAETGESSPVAPIALGISQPYDGRDRGDGKGVMIPLAGFLEELSMRIHGIELPGKIPRRDSDPYP